MIHLPPPKKKKKMNDFSPNQEIYIYFLGEGEGSSPKILELEKTTGHMQTTWYTEAQQHKRC